jgi:histidine triad (HIT) family protein
MEDCIFCKIARGDIPCEKIYENDSVIAFRDIHPIAPFHTLVIPKVHIRTLNDIEPKHADMISKMLEAAKEVARRGKVSETGYRTIINCNSDAGQEVFHMHLHVIGGRRLGRMA